MYSVQVTTVNRKTIQSLVVRIIIRQNTQTKLSTSSITNRSIKFNNVYYFSNVYTTFAQMTIQNIYFLTRKCVKSYFCYTFHESKLIY